MQLRLLERCRVQPIFVQASAAENVKAFYLPTNFCLKKAFAYGKSGFPYKKLLTLRFGNGSFIRLIGKRVQIPCSPAAVSPVISPVYSFSENATVWIKQAKREGKADAGTSRKTCRHSIKFSIIYTSIPSRKG